MGLKRELSTKHCYLMVSGNLFPFQIQSGQISLYGLYRGVVEIWRLWHHLSSSGPSEQVQTFNWPQASLHCSLRIRNVHSGDCSIARHPLVNRLRLRPHFPEQVVDRIVQDTRSDLQTHYNISSLDKLPNWGSQHMFRDISKMFYVQQAAFMESLVAIGWILVVHLLPHSH